MCCQVNTSPTILGVLDMNEHSPSTVYVRWRLGSDLNGSIAYSSSTDPMRLCNSGLFELFESRLKARSGREIDSDVLICVIARKTPRKPTPNAIRIPKFWSMK